MSAENGTRATHATHALERGAMARANAVEGSPDGEVLPAVVANSAQAIVHAALHLTEAVDRLVGAVNDHARDLERSR